MPRKVPLSYNHVPLADHRLMVAMGTVQGVAASLHFGHNPAVGTSFEVIRESGGTHTLLTVPTTLAVTSSSTSDDSGGTGALTVRLVGLDSNFNELIETVTLDGTTVVLSTGLYCRINSAQVLTAGTGQTNAGDIYITDDAGTHTAGVPDDLALVEAKIPAGHSLAETTIFTVPLGKTLYVTNVLIFSTSGKSVTFQGHLFNPTAAVETVIFEGVVQDSAFSIQRGGLVALPARFSVWIEAKVDSNTAEVSGAIDGWLIDDIRLDD